MIEDEDTAKTVQDAMSFPKKASPSMDFMMLERVIDIASVSAESSTRAAAALTSVKSEIESLRVEISSSRTSTRNKLSDLETRVGQLVTRVDSLVSLRTEELDNKRAERASANALESDRLETVRSVVTSIFTPQTMAIILTIVAAAFGIHFNQPAPIIVDSSQQSDTINRVDPKLEQRQDR